MTDANGNRVSGETVTLSSGGSMTDNDDGTYTGTVTSTTTAGNRTITATDGSIFGAGDADPDAGAGGERRAVVEPDLDRRQWDVDFDRDGDRHRRQWQSRPR